MSHDSSYSLHPTRDRPAAPRGRRHADAMGARPRARAGARDLSPRSSPSWARAIVDDLETSGALEARSRGGGIGDARASLARCARALHARCGAAMTSMGMALSDVEALVTDGLDPEQVWTQVEARWGVAATRCARACAALKKKFGDDRSGVEGLFDVDVDGGTSSEGDGVGNEGEDGEDVDEEDADEDADPEETDEGGRSASGKRSSGSRTRKVFKNPGMFDLDEMERFMDDGDARDARRRGRADAEEEDEDAEEDDSDEDEDDEADIYRDVSESDDGIGDDDEDSDEADDLDDALAYTARLAGVSASGRKKTTAKKSKGKKAQDLMFEDFFGKGKPLGGTKGGRLGASNDAELNELSDEEEDMYNALEGDEDEDEDEEEDLEGELETGIAGKRGLENHDDDDDEYVEEDEGEEEEEEEDFASDLEERDDEVLDDLDKKLEAELDAELARARVDDDDGEDYARSGKKGPRSAFQRQQEALAKQIDKLEKEAIGEKSWILKGEADAKDRPMNSALETDLEFEHVMAPAPVISAEITQKLEDIIKKRIIEGRFDDVERVQPVEERERKELPQLDDTKSTKGLGDIYADEYMKQKVGVALGEKEDPVVAEVKKLWALLSYRLDALSRTGFIEEPKDIEERIDRDLAARAAGNVVPSTFKEDDGLAPEEIFVGGGGKGGQRGSAAGFLKADEELTKEERKAGRAKRKRKSKAVHEEKEVAKAKRDREREAQHKAEEDAGFIRKAPKVAMLAVGSAAGKAKSDFSKSSKVFGMLQDAKEQEAARGGAKKSKSDSTKNKSSLKL